MEPINKHYSQLSKIADKHIEKIQANNKVQTEQTIAAIMFIKSHKNYIRYLFVNSKIRLRHNNALKFIRDNVGDFDKDVVSNELNKIGLLSHKFIHRFLILFFSIIYWSIVPIFYKTEDAVTLALYVINIIGMYGLYACFCFIIGGLFCSSTLPLYFYKKY